MGFPCKILSFDNIDMPDLGDMSTSIEVKKVKYYGYKITTNKGDIVLDYRNASNGLCAGRLIWNVVNNENPPDSFYGGIFQQNISNQTWIDVITDI